MQMCSTAELAEQTRLQSNISILTKTFSDKGYHNIYRLKPTRSIDKNNMSLPSTLNLFCCSSEYIDRLLIVEKGIRDVCYMQPQTICQTLSVSNRYPGITTSYLSNVYL